MLSFHVPLYQVTYSTNPCDIVRIFRLKKVLFITVDGALMNQFLFKMHDTSESLLYKVKNRYVSECRDVLFSDPPHLIKTTQNC